jgi:hypothetical protein
MCHVRRWSSICIPLCLAGALVLLPNRGCPQDKPEAVPGVPSTENLVGQLEVGYKTYASVLSGFFGKPAEAEQDFEGVRSAVVTLAAEGVEKVLAGNGSGHRLLGCLTDLSQDGVLASHLASLARRSGRPAFIKEYLRAWCNVPLATPYSKGKVAVPGAKVGRMTGDVVADKAMVWLSADRGFVGGMNGVADPGEWVDLKFSITNRSKGQAYRAATARLTVRGDKDVLCPIWPPLDSEVPVPAPAGCGQAVVVGPPAELGDISPGERVTVGTFGLVIAPEVKSGLVTLALLVEAPGTAASTTFFTLPVGKPPLLEVAGLAVDDDGAGQSRGNGNGRIEPGERIELKAQVTALGVKQLSKVAVSAHQFSGFLDLAPRVLGLSALPEKKPVSLGGDFQFEVPTIESMAAVPADRLDRQFFIDREVNLWIAASGCAGKADVPRDWASSTPSSYLCPAGAPGYRYVLPVSLSIEFDQVLVINTVPVGARIKVNGVAVGETARGVPVVFTQIAPVRNSILYYQVSAEAPGYETRTVEVPVIFKDRTADNLTASLNLELEETRTASVEAPPTEVEQPPFWEEAKPKSEPEPLPPEPETAGGFFLHAGGAWRALKPGFDHDELLKYGKPGIQTSGFEIGGGYQFGRFFFLSLDSSVLFPVESPAARFYAPLPQENGAGETGSTGGGGVVYYEIGSLVAWTLCAQPGFQASMGPVSVQAAAGFQLEGVDADAPEQMSGDGVTPVRLSQLGYSARLSAGLAWRIVDGFGVYARGLFAIPRNGFDWGATAGIRLDLF